MGYQLSTIASDPDTGLSLAGAYVHADNVVLNNQQRTGQATCEFYASHDDYMAGKQQIRPGLFVTWSDGRPTTAEKFTPNFIGVPMTAAGAAWMAVVYPLLLNHPTTAAYLAGATEV